MSAKWKCVWGAGKSGHIEVTKWRVANGCQRWQLQCALKTQETNANTRVRGRSSAEYAKGSSCPT